MMYLFIFQANGLFIQILNNCMAVSIRCDAPGSATLEVRGVAWTGEGYMVNQQARCRPLNGHTSIRAYQHQIMYFAANVVILIDRIRYRYAWHDRNDRWHGNVNWRWLLAVGYWQES